VTARCSPAHGKSVSSSVRRSIWRHEQRGTGLHDVETSRSSATVAEFYHRIWQHYQEPPRGAGRNARRSAIGARHAAVDLDKRTMWVFEPHVAERCSRTSSRSTRFCLPDEWLDRQAGVRKDGTRIVSITMLSGKTSARIFLDASYEGDLMPRPASLITSAGVERSLRRDVQWRAERRAPSRPLLQSTDQPTWSGRPSSGLLPRISASRRRERQADRRIQAYCFRMCLTQVADNRVPFPAEGTIPASTSCCCACSSVAGASLPEVRSDPNAKTDTNNHGHSVRQYRDEL